MFIASKYEEIYPINLNIIHEKISHTKFSKETIIKQEKLILEKMNFSIKIATIFEFSSLVFEEIKAMEKFLLKEKQVEYFNKVILYLNKLVLYEFEIISCYKFHEISAGIFFVSLKILEQINQEIKIEEIV